MIKLKPRYLSFITRSVPNFLWPLKWLLLKFSLKKVGLNFRFGYNSVFADHRLIEVGDNVFMGQNTLINTAVPVIIGNNVMFGPNVSIMAGDHNISHVGVPMRFVKEGGYNIPVILEDDVWVGSGVLILKGVRIGESAVVGAGSVVTKSLPPYSICVGNPCKPIKLRLSGTALEKHLFMVGSKYSKENILEQFSLYNKSV